MTAVAGCRIDAAINAVARQIIPAVLHAAVVLGLVFKRWLEFAVGGVAIAAKTLIVA